MTYDCLGVQWSGKMFPDFKESLAKVLRYHVGNATYYYAGCRRPPTLVIEVTNIQSDLIPPCRAVAVPIQAHLWTSKTTGLRNYILLYFGLFFLSKCIYEIKDFYPCISMCYTMELKNMEPPELVSTPY